MSIYQVPILLPRQVSRIRFQANAEVVLANVGKLNPKNGWRRVVVCVTDLLFTRSVCDVDRSGRLVY